METSGHEVFEKKVVLATIAWLESMVIGLNLCPFAKAIHVKKQIRYAVSFAENTDSLLADLRLELGKLVATEPGEIESTLIVHPKVLNEFLDYNDFLAECDRAIEELELVGIVQIASFHPEYQFAGTKAGDITNYTNRSPYPTLHLLREASVSKAVDSFPDVDAIYRTNMTTLRKIGKSRLAAMAVELVRDRGEEGFSCGE
jgi:hypothetical protein